MRRDVRTATSSFGRFLPGLAHGDANWRED